MKGQCKLCLKPNQELRKSHIIPEFMYQKLYDDNPKRYYTLKIGDNNSKRIEQKGIRENLLCNSCEGLLSEYENYASETIYAKNRKNEAVLKKANQNVTQTFFLYEFENFDYAKFKLFEMSLLWRLLISSKYETKKIDTHEEKLRQAILSKKPLKFFQYGCMLQTILYKKEQIAGGFILNPFFTKSNDVDFMHILIDGFMYTFSITDKQTLPNEITENYLQENGNMNIIGRLIFKDKSLFDKVFKAYEYYKNEINDFTK
jgi:hypothetical protein